MPASGLRGFRLLRLPASSFRRALDDLIRGIAIAVVSSSPLSGRLEANCMLWTIVVLLLLFWLFGLVLDIAGGLIHLLLVVVLVIVAFRLLTGRRV
jgi:hypothetical protein